MGRSLRWTLLLLLMVAGCRTGLSKQGTSLPYSLGGVLYADDFSGNLSAS